MTDDTNLFPFPYVRISAVRRMHTKQSIGDLTTAVEFRAIVRLMIEDIPEPQVHLSSRPALIPTCTVVRPLRMDDALLAVEARLVRHSVDSQWRNILQHEIQSFQVTASNDLILLGKLLSENGHLPSVGECRHWIEPFDAPNSRSERPRNPNAPTAVPPKEQLDWVLMFRTATVHGIGVTLEERTVELGTSFRTFRRCRQRLAQWLTDEPRRLTPQRVIASLKRRFGEHAFAPLRDLNPTLVCHFARDVAHAWHKGAPPNGRHRACNLGRTDRGTVRTLLEQLNDGPPNIRGTEPGSIA